MPFQTYWLITASAMHRECVYSAAYDNAKTLSNYLKIHVENCLPWLLPLSNSRRN